MARLLVLFLALTFVGFARAFQGLGALRARRSSVSMRAPDEKAPENETEEQLRARMQRKARKMMFNPDGVAYAPWVSKQINEDVSGSGRWTLLSAVLLPYSLAFYSYTHSHTRTLLTQAIIDNLIRKEKGSEIKGTKASILERGEIQGSDGMRWRMDGGLVDLAWSTGGESGNKGFIVEKRPSYGGDYQMIASFKEVEGLKSRGAGGGKYRYTDPATAGGSWIYRVKDCDGSNKQDVLCQCFVEVTSDAEKNAQSGVLVGFLAVLGAAAVAGVALNPSL